MSESSTQSNPPRVLALCGNMVVVFGAERITFEILRVLRESGVEVHCIINEWENHRIRPLAESIGASTSIGIYGYALKRTINPLRLLSNAFQVVRTSSGLLRDCKRFRASHVLAPDFIAVLKNAPALLFLRASGVSVVLRSSTNPNRGRFYDLLWRWMISPLTSLVVVPSKFTASRCEDAGVPSDKVRVIRNTVPRRTISPDADAEVVALARSRRTLLCIGQIAPFKGVHLAVAASLALLDRGEDVQLVIGGAAPQWPPDYVRYYEAQREEVIARGAQERVHFVGSVSNVAELMEASYLLLAPIPEEESFCLVVLEAKYAGLPVVAFRRGAVPELVEHEKTGYLCRGLDGDSLLEGIDYFLSNPKRRNEAMEASRRAVSGPANDCAPEAFAQAWRSVFTG